MTTPNFANKLTFNAIDVETANADLSSICQIGIAHVHEGQIVDTWKSLIDPDDWFDDWNVAIHGIIQDDVEDAPMMPEVIDELCRRLRSSILVSHTWFDKVSLERAMDKYHLEQLDVTWLDSAKIVRRAWPEKYGRRGYGLSSVAYDLGIDFQHHDALEDARAAAAIVVRACVDTGLGVEAWLDEVKRPIGLKRKSTKSATKERRNPDGNLFGEAVVFTGKLSFSRSIATKRALGAGCDVQSSVNERTTMLVVGMQDKSKLNGYEKSFKHRKAEAAVSRGIQIQIISEADFLAIT